MDPFEDGLGVYFDEQGEINSVAVPVGSTVSAYLVATRVTADGFADGFWAGPLIVDLVEEWIPDPEMGPGLPFTATSRVAGTNTWDPSDWPDNWIGFNVAFFEPYPISESIVLADLEVYIEVVAPVGVFLAEGEGGLYVGDDFHLLATHFPPLNTIPPFIYFVASVNGQAPVGATDRTWTEVRGLYR
jgi:hypothetical protein